MIAQEGRVTNIIGQIIARLLRNAIHGQIIISGSYTETCEIIDSEQIPNSSQNLQEYAGITCAYSVNRGALCGLQRNLIQNLHVLLMYVR